MTDYIPYYISPDGTKQYTKKVILITNSQSFSAAEEITLMLKSFPYVIHIGDETQGGSGTTPIGMELPNGWAFRVSSILLLDTKKRPIENGIRPDISVQISQQDINLNNDKILEKAIELAK
jgi:C-terminal processing protease CtpA/Prc